MYIYIYIYMVYNFFLWDLLRFPGTDIGLRLALLLVLQGVDRMVCHFGLPCGSFVLASRGTTLRSFLTPMGNPNIPSVALGNLLTSRCGA